MQKAPQALKKKSEHEEITAIVEKAMIKETEQIRSEFKSEMVQLREEITAETKMYMDQITVELRDSLTTLKVALGNSMQAIQNLTQPALTNSNASTSSKQINKV